jgi:hypothetical protein
LKAAFCENAYGLSARKRGEAVRIRLVNFLQYVVAYDAILIAVSFS